MDRLPDEGVTEMRTRGMCHPVRKRGNRRKMCPMGHCIAAIFWLQFIAAMSKPSFQLWAIDSP
jgi:hypothetical protein